MQVRRKQVDMSHQRGRRIKNRGDRGKLANKWLTCLSVHIYIFYIWLFSLLRDLPDPLLRFEPVRCNGPIDFDLFWLVEASLDCLRLATDAVRDPYRFSSIEFVSRNPDWYRPTLVALRVLYGLATKMLLGERRWRESVEQPGILNKRISFRKGTKTLTQVGRASFRREVWQRLSWHVGFRELDRQEVAMVGMDLFQRLEVVAEITSDWWDVKTTTYCVMSRYRR